MFAQTPFVSDDIHHVLSKQSSVDAIIVLDNQWQAPTYINNWDKKDKANFVYYALQDHADRTQKELVHYFTKENNDFQSFFIFNGIATKITADQLSDLRQMDGISHILYDEWHYNDLPVKDPISLRNPPLEWGITKIKADSAWLLGYEGQGIVIAGQDTGYDFDNPLIKGKYRGFDGENFDHNYNWHDAIHDSIPPKDSNNPCGFNSEIPCDDHGHGTHTMGTMVGQDENNGIGVAPLATWIGCRNMDRGVGRPSTYIECFEWFLAPTDLEGNNPNPDMAPQVINNSWGCPESEGCNSDNWIFMETVIDNLVTAGIMVVVSAGNDGIWQCGSINRPPSMFKNAFTVGASNMVDTVAGFSSKGLVTIDSSFLLKPDVVAPGVGVRSITLDEGFASWSGTSMAGPHVAGTVALMLNANPNLSGHVEEISNILRMTAVPISDTLECNGIPGNAVPNPVSGYGRIDALAAVKSALLWVNVQDTQKEDEFTLYPNPTHGSLTIESKSPKPSQLSLLDFSGKLVEVYKLDEQPYHNIQLNLLPGLYIYVLENDSVHQTGKLIVN